MYNIFIGQFSIYFMWVGAVVVYLTIIICIGIGLYEFIDWIKQKRFERRERFILWLEEQLVEKRKIKKTAINTDDIIQILKEKRLK